MIRIVLYQNTNQKNETAYGKWYPRVQPEETVGIDELAEHMASHNTPFSKGAIKGMLTDAVICTKELLLLGKNVKFPDLAIFSIGLRVKQGVANKDDFSVAKCIEGLRLRARATGELSSSNLDATIRRVDTVKSTNDSGSTSPDDKDNAGEDSNTPGGGESGGSDTGGSGSGSSGSESGNVNMD